MWFIVQPYRLGGNLLFKLKATDSLMVKGSSFPPLLPLLLLVLSAWLLLSSLPLTLAAAVAKSLPRSARCTHPSPTSSLLSASPLLSCCFPQSSLLQSSPSLFGPSGLGSSVRLRGERVGGSSVAGAWASSDAGWGRLKGGLRGSRSHELPSRPTRNLKQVQLTTLRHIWLTRPNLSLQPFNAWSSTASPCWL